MMSEAFFRDLDIPASDVDLGVGSGSPVAHVEAGLRGFDRPMAEAIDRTLTDAISAPLFTTEPAANENVVRERMPAGRVHFVGNVMIDTLFRCRERTDQSLVLGTLGLEPGKYATLVEVPIHHRPT